MVLPGAFPVHGGQMKSGDPERQFISAVGFSLQFAPNGAFTAVTTAER